MNTSGTIDNQSTTETKLVEQAFRDAGFHDVGSYRHNSASIRVRIRDERFRGLSRVARLKRLEPIIQQLPEDTQQDLIFVLAIAPGEETGEFLTMNHEFENPRSSGF